MQVAEPARPAEVTKEDGEEDAAVAVADRVSMDEAEHLEPHV